MTNLRIRKYANEPRKIFGFDCRTNMNIEIVRSMWTILYFRYKTLNIDAHLFTETKINNKEEINTKSGCSGLLTSIKKTNLRFC